MTYSSYEAALKAAEEELQEWLEKRSAIDARIIKLKQSIETLRALTDLQPLPPIMTLPAVGITEGIRQVLEDNKIPPSAIQIRDGLLEKGFPLDTYANDMSVIHNTLNRLIRQGEVVPVKNPSARFKRV